jgi:hypothetical protein
MIATLAPVPFIAAGLLGFTRSTRTPSLTGRRPRR